MNQQMQQQANMYQPGAIPASMNHGGHEIFEIHEILSGTVSMLDQCTLLREHVKDPELRDIMDRQHQFVQDSYNITVEAFRSGQDPSHPTGSYKMNQSNDVLYGLKPGQPKKPMQSASELNDAAISQQMLQMVKMNAGMMTKGALEVTNPVVRRVIGDNVQNLIEMGYELFLYQNKNHYYQVPQLAQADAQQLISAFDTAGNAGQGQMMQ
ncbi:spore coat protein [Bacillus lacus]|uniref:Spore coat protein n=1 Tax=Metabacillus lacus TaxID=1983721 RepID=A0A7X2J2A7_9BACI|nr:spore coat protein [Metabacillus lacus]MRX74036.1 spore coat protein [Metabacillus lacus]